MSRSLIWTAKFAAPVLAVVVLSLSASHLAVAQENTAQPASGNGSGNGNGNSNPAPAVVIPQVITLEAVAGEGGGIVFSTGPAEGRAFGFNLNGGGVQFAGPGSVGGGFGGGLGGGWVPQDDLGLLALEQYHDDLGLIPEQKDRLAIVRRDLQDQRTKAFADIRKMEPAKIAEVAKQTETRLKEESQRKVQEILLPHQVERLKQMRVQLQMRNRGASALAGGELANTLGLTDDQKKRLADKQREAELELRRKVDELRKQLVKDIVQDVLTADQRESLAKLVGTELQAKSVDPNAAGAPNATSGGNGAGNARPRLATPAAP
ncbi:MAG: hypothetical protein ACKO38_18965 [Planctomycetota bacterium]